MLLFCTAAARGVYIFLSNTLDDNLSSKAVGRCWGVFDSFDWFDLIRNTQFRPSDPQSPSETFRSSETFRLSETFRPTDLQTFGHLQTHFRITLGSKFVCTKVHACFLISNPITGCISGLRPDASTTHRPAKCGVHVDVDIISLTWMSASMEPFGFA